MRSIISRAGVAVQHGKFEFATTENHSNVKGECDVVIETPSTIYFIEVKNKVLTAPARSGEIVDLAKDLTQGMLHACLQAFSHAQLLKQHQCMDLEHDGETYHLQLRGRRVEAVAMSLADLGGFQDRTALHEFLRLYVRGEIRADTPQTQALFAEQTEYASRLRRLVAEMPEEEQRLPFFNCHFMSLPQLMTLLQHVSNPTDFDHEMGRMRHQTMGTQDWYYEYNVSRQRDQGRV